MENDEGKKVDLYIPRKCSATNRLITAKDHASVQINVALLDSNGVTTGEHKVYALCGYVRTKGEGDAVFTRLVESDGIVKGAL